MISTHSLKTFVKQHKREIIIGCAILAIGAVIAMTYFTVQYSVVDNSKDIERLSLGEKMRNMFKASESLDMQNQSGLSALHYALIGIGCVIAVALIITGALIWHSKQKSMECKNDMNCKNSNTMIYGSNSKNKIIEQEPA